jgi:hypothetical protein
MTTLSTIRYDLSAWDGEISSHSRCEGFKERLVSATWTFEIGDCSLQRSRKDFFLDAGEISLLYEQRISKQLDVKQSILHAMD